jgi:endonuclease YncB( thermonuclease family)
MFSDTQIKIAISLSAFLILFFAHTALAAQFVVTRVIDGDMLTAESEGYKFKVRLVGIDTPETSRKKNEPGQTSS